MTNPALRYFQALNLKPNAGPTEIKKAFKELAFKYHPDRNPHNTLAGEKFHQVAEAYAYLSGNWEIVHALQAQGMASPAAQKYFRDILVELFDFPVDAVSLPKKDMVIQLQLSNRQLKRGHQKKQKVLREELCSQCEGKGVERRAKVNSCTYCFGLGTIENQSGVETSCPKCGGRGIITLHGCLACMARGVSLQKVKLTFKIPPASQAGQRLIFNSFGHAYAVGLRGDIYVTLQLKPLSRFMFDARRLLCHLRSTTRAKAQWFKQLWRK